MYENFLKIPADLRECPQWVGWKAEYREGAKPAKVPYNLLTDQRARVGDWNDWNDWGTALMRCGRFNGLGFCLSDNDPFIFIDLDETNDPKEIARQLEIVERFRCYSEISPSGKGLHLVCRAGLGLGIGRRSGSVEIYSRDRYMTMTGNIYRDLPICDCSQAVADLVGSMETSNKSITPAVWDKSTGVGVEILTDRQIYDMAVSASNGPKFLALWNGDFAVFYGTDQSRADFALIDILAFYTDNKMQVMRLFRQSALGQRPKANRADYVGGMINKAFDRKVPLIDFSGLMQKPDPGFVGNLPDKQPVGISSNPVVEGDCVTSLVDEALTMPPGLVGELAQFIYQQAWKPVPEIAMMGAIGLLAGICGRSYNVSGTGLNLYLLLLAETGRGKEAISNGFDKIQEMLLPIMPIIGDFFGPADLGSGQGLVRYMANHPLKTFVSVFGEFGPTLRKITSPQANSADKMTLRVLLEFYGKSGRGKKVHPTVYSDAERNTAICESPAFSFIAESATSWFDNYVDSDMIVTGFLPRMIILQYDGIRVPSNKNGPSVMPSSALLEAIGRVAGNALTAANNRTVIEVRLDNTADKLSDELDRFCDNKINQSEERVIRELWNRVHLNVSKLAGILAVGLNATEPVIDKICWQWAERFVKFAIQRLEDKFRSGIVANLEVSHSATTEAMKQFLFRYCNNDNGGMGLTKKQIKDGVTQQMVNGRVIPIGHLRNELLATPLYRKSKAGASVVFQRAIAELIESGDLAEVPRSQAIDSFKYHGKLYWVRSSNVGGIG